MFTKSIITLISLFISSTTLAETTVSTNLVESPQQYCELKPEADYGKIPMGSLETIASTPDWIGFSQKVGRIVGKKGMFNLDSLYEMSNGTESARFRINEAYFSKGSSYLGSMAWESGKSFTDPGVYRFFEVKTRKKVYDQTLTMVGDSITWWSSGRYLRCLLSKQMPGVGFTGPHTDVYGFGHAGEGGNNTKDVLARLKKIQPADTYFILLGTNDWPFASPQRTAANLKLIANILSRRGGKVIISTLLPRLDEHNARNRKVNKILMSWNGEGCNCEVVDLYSKFSKIEEPKTLYWDKGLHPNLTGYTHIADILAPKLEKLISDRAVKSLSASN